MNDNGYSKEILILKLHSKEYPSKHSDRASYGKRSSDESVLQYAEEQHSATDSVQYPLGGVQRYRFECELELNARTRHPDIVAADIRAIR